MIWTTGEMSSSNSKAEPSGSQSGPQAETTKMDIYRPIASGLQRNLKPFIPNQSTSSSIPDLLSLDATSYSQRLAGKTLLLDPHEAMTAGGPSTGASASGSVSDLVRGKKRNRGDPKSKGKARTEAEERAGRMDALGLDGMRKVRRRLKGGIKRGMQIEYNALLPIHYLHTLYLVQLFSLRPKPPHAATPKPTLSTDAKARPSVSASTSRDASSTLPDGLTSDGISSLLSKADFTGISLLVLSSRNPSLEGISGLAIEETASTFVLVSTDSKVRIIPKDGTLFRLSFPAYAPPSLTTSFSSSSSSSSSSPTSSHRPSTQPAQGSSVRRSAPSAGKAKAVDASESVGSEGAATDGSLRLDGDTAQDIAEHLRTCPRIQIDLLGSSFLYRSAERAGRKFRPAQGKGGGSGWGEEWVRGEWNEVFERVDPAAVTRTARYPVKAKNGSTSRKEGHKGRSSGSQSTLCEDQEVDHSDKKKSKQGYGKTRDTLHRADVLGGPVETETGERGLGAMGERKRSKSRRKDPPAGGNLEVHF